MCSFRQRKSRAVNHCTNVDDITHSNVLDALRLLNVLGGSPLDQRNDDLSHGGSAAMIGAGTVAYAAGAVATGVSSAMVAGEMAATRMASPYTCRYARGPRPCFRGTRLGVPPRNSVWNLGRCKGSHLLAGQHYCRAARDQDRPEHGAERVASPLLAVHSAQRVVLAANGDAVECNLEFAGFTANRAPSLPIPTVYGRCRCRSTESRD